MKNKYLKHYGVLGMHWGVRRYQPYPSGKNGKFLGIVKRTVSDAGNKVSSAATKAGEQIKMKTKSKVSEKKDARAEKKKLRIEASEANKSVRQYLRDKETQEKLRTAALETHNPKVLAKGMQYLSDEELRKQVQRLTQEQSVRKMVQNMPKTRMEKAKDKIGELVLNDVVKPMVKDAVSKTSPKLSKIADSKIDELASQPNNTQSTSDSAAASIAQTIAKSSNVNPQKAAAKAKSIKQFVEHNGRTVTKVKKNRPSNENN